MLIFALAFWLSEIVSTLWELNVLFFPYGFLFCIGGEILWGPDLECQGFFWIDAEVAPKDF